MIEHLKIKLLTLFLHIKKLVTYIVCNHLVATVALEYIHIRIDIVSVYLSDAVVL